MKIVSIFGFSLFACSCQATILSAQDVAAAILSPSLGLSPQTEVLLPLNPEEPPDAVQRWVIGSAPTFLVSVKPASGTDVQKLVEFASTHDIPFLATSGRHGFTESLGNLTHGLEINLGFLRNVTVDAKANTMTVGGGVRFGDALEPLYNAGKEITVGSSICVGMLGAGLGGGVGRWQGLRGLVSDSLQSVSLVTNEGRSVEASASENSDLFWAIRGAGFNYGIVTSATFQVYDLTAPQVTNIDYVFPANSSSFILNFLKKYEESLPAKMAYLTTVMYSEDHEGLVFNFNAVYAGPRDVAESMLQPLTSATAPLTRNVSEIPWKDINIIDGANSCPKGLSRTVYGGGIKTYHMETFQKFFNELEQLYLENPDSRSSMAFIEHFPKQAVLAVPEDSTAYPARDITAHLLFNFGYTSPEMENSMNSFLRRARDRFEATSGFSTPHIYVNYGHGDEAPEVLYGKTKLPELRSLKARWDPKNLFRFNHPLV